MPALIISCSVFLDEGGERELLGCGACRPIGPRMGAGEDRIAAIFSRTKATLSRWRDAVAVDAAMSVVRGETHQPCPTVAILRIMSDGYSDEGANSPALRDGPGLEGRRVADVAIERASRVYLSADGVGLGACETGAGGVVPAQADG